jgi:small subunit ribosomal protein S13
MLLYKQVNLPENKEIRNSLFNIYGFGYYKAALTCSKIGLSYPFFISNLNIYNFNILCCILDYLTFAETKIIRFIQSRIFRHIDLKTYRGIKFKFKLPVRGQRTRSNAKSCKRQVFYKV